MWNRRRNWKFDKWESSAARCDSTDERVRDRNCHHHRHYHFHRYLSVYRCDMGDMDGWVSNEKSHHCLLLLSMKSDVMLLIVMMLDSVLVVVVDLWGWTSKKGCRSIGWENRWSRWIMGDVYRWHERHHDGCGDHSFFLLFGDSRKLIGYLSRMSTFGWKKTLGAGAPAHKWNYVTFNKSSVEVVRPLDISWQVVQAGTWQVRCLDSIPSIQTESAHVAKSMSVIVCTLYLFSIWANRIANKCLQ